MSEGKVEQDRAKLFAYSDGERFQGKDTLTVFKAIAKENTWDESESVSGPGSTVEQTSQLIQDLPRIFRKFNIHSILDLPCGDFNWMQRIDLSSITYTGADIVPEIIERNNNIFGQDQLIFKVMNLIEDHLGKYDLLICRDCLVHFSIQDSILALDNIKESQIKFLLTTTFTEQESNTDIQTGGWRPMNLMVPPFDFPEPLILINEHCTEKGGQFHDKCLGLWKVEDL